jgi:cation diffusion facilitator family transporter
MSDSAERAGQQRTTVVSIVTASSLMILMLGVGLATASLGLISTGIESTGDVVAAVVTFFAVRVGARPADESHPFGHRRAENLSALAEASILLGGGLLVVIEAVQRLIGGDSSLSARWYVFVVISLAIVVNVSRALIATRSARRYGSAALRSNSFHFASDVGGSVAVLVGLIAVRAGFHDGDAISALIVAGFIFSAAARLIFENAQVLMDTAPADAQAAARAAILALSPEIELDRLRLRESGGPLLRRRRRRHSARTGGGRGSCRRRRRRGRDRAGAAHHRRRRPRGTPAARPDPPRPRARDRSRRTGRQRGSRHHHLRPR